MSSWTPEKVKMLVQLWEQGLSASQVAAQIGNVTRNAVIGKIHRIGLAERKKTQKITTNQQKITRKPSKPSLNKTFKTVGANALKVHPEEIIDVKQNYIAMPQNANVVEIATDNNQKCDIMRLTEKTCRWPIGDPGDENFGFCGKNIKEGSPYCQHHYTIAYYPAERGKKRTIQKQKLISKT